MNRQIKFRALSLNREKWYYGVPLEYSRDNGYSTTVIVRNIEGCGYEDIPNMEEVIPDTIGQFTGLTDKNGKEIYEGDIIRIDCHPWLDWKELESVNAEVVFENFAIIAQWRNPDAGKSYGIFDDDVVESEYVTEILCNLPNTIEVIGNIHNNPIEE